MMFTLSSVHFLCVSSVPTGYGERHISTIKRNTVGIVNIHYLLTNLSEHVISPAYVRRHTR